MFGTEWLLYVESLTSVRSYAGPTDNDLKRTLTESCVAGKEQQIDLLTIVSSHPVSLFLLWDNMRVRPGAQRATKHIYHALVNS